MQTGTSPHVWTVDSVTPGTTGYLTVTGVVTDGASVVGTTIENSGLISASNDSYPGNNSSAAFAVEGVALAISKTALPAIAAPGGTITYTLHFTNTGSGPVQGAVITDSVPVSVSVSAVNSSGLVITQTNTTPYAWQVERMAPNASAILTITGVLSGSAELVGTSLENSAVITSPYPDKDESDN